MTFEMGIIVISKDLLRIDMYMVLTISWMQGLLIAGKTVFGYSLLLIVCDVILSGRQEIECWDNYV